VRFSEILRLVWINILQNKFKVILTSIGIVVGAATIVMVLAIGRGGQMDVADQFKNINAGAIDITYSRNFGGQQGGQAFGGNFQPSSGSSSSGQSTNRAASATGSAGQVVTLLSTNSSSAVSLLSSSGQNTQVQAQQGFQPPDGGGFPPEFFQNGGTSGSSSRRVNFERITLSDSDVEDLEIFVPDISSATISYSTRSNVNGGNLTSETSYTIGGVKSDYAELSNLQLAVGDFLTASNSENAEKVCVLGATAATDIFGSAAEAYDSILYIDNRPYVVSGVLETVGSVASGISPDDAVFIPYETGIKYITGKDVSPTITVIAANMDQIDSIKENIQTVLGQSYPNATFTIEDAGSKMYAANASNRTLTMLLFAMAAIVFIVGGIGIMNVLFVSIKERTKEIGILKSIGCRKKDILMEFLMEASFISVIGGILGVGVSFLVTPVIQLLSVRVEHTVTGFILAILFAIITGTAFGFYPALKASKLIPVQALNAI
jgi:ABC-type antimicrobial peptide transport system permease subunit